MLDEQITPAAEVNEPEETVNDDTQEETTEAEATVGELQEDTEDTSGSDNIPKARLDKEIKRRKELEAKVEELSKKEEEGDSTPAEESEKSDLEARLAKIEGKEKAEKLNATLEGHIAKALEDAPEFKDVVNTEVIKQMAMNPANKNKTYSQLLEDAYGNALGGKRTIETTTPRGGAENEKLDVSRAHSDNDYLKKVLSDPVLKKQYNADLEQHIML